MSPRALVYAAAAAVLLAVPAAASAGTTAIRFSPQNTDGSVVANSIVVVSCDATKPMTGGLTGSIAVSGGTLDGGVTSLPVTFVCPTTTCTASANWTTPAPVGATVTCSSQGTFGSPSVLSVPVTVAAPPVTTPVFADAPYTTLPPATVLTGTTHDVTALAVDPGRTVTYFWTATGGSFANPASASTTWTAPAGSGAYIVTVTATNDLGGTASKSLNVTVALSTWQSTLPVTMSGPSRLATAPSGDLFVVDGTGKLFMLTRKGELKVAVALPSKASAVAASTDTLFVAVTDGIVKLDPLTGRSKGRLRWPWSQPPSGLSYDPLRKNLWGSNYLGGKAVALAEDGTVVAAVDTTVYGTTARPLVPRLVDVAFDAVNDELWVAEDTVEKNPDMTAGQMLHAFRAADLSTGAGGAAAWVRSTATYGSTAAGQCLRVNGAYVDAEGTRLFVSDSQRGTIQAYTRLGASLGSIGTMGTAPGNLAFPAGLNMMVNGDLVVANAGLNRVDRFGTGAALPTCAGDADCDGIPDAKDLKPNDPTDALADPDGDGLTNLEEYLLGTDPMKKDTDGDGFDDRTEVLAGNNPLDANDHRPSVVAGALGAVQPGLVTLNAVTSNASGCSASWSQRPGSPKVTLRSSDTFTPNFIAREAATYVFDVVAVCGTATSPKATATVQVVNVTPMADAGRTIVTAPGRTVSIQAGFSTDANGDTLTYGWAKALTDPTPVAPRGSTLVVRPMAEGYYEYELTATDKGSLQGKAAVGVIVVDGGLPTAMVASPVVTATAGGSVTLDASASVPAGVTFAWQQVEGAAVGAIAATATPSVTVPSAGRYIFEVTASKGGVTSPPAHVVVLAGAGGVVPTASAAAAATGAPNTAITLDGSASSGAVAWAWRQVAGPAAGLSAADAAVATAVPFSAGVYVFELTVADASGAVSAPATVRIDVPAAGKALPVANVVAPASAVVGELVVLNAKTSTGAARYRWSQVAGPWVAIDGTSSAPVFSAPVAGTYSFELVVDDGTVRSAPATVTVNVL